MSRAVVFRTPGLIPVEAFTMIGVNAKPNSGNPIGFFGTGLKYAIAVCLRLECKVTVFIGLTEYVFETKAEDFRGKEFAFVYMKKRKGILSKWQTTKLPFTLEYGKTWEVWQAYRELHSNTLDENGEIFEDHSADTDAIPTTDTTLIIVEGEVFLQAYYDRFKTFLPEGLRERVSSNSIQILDKQSKHIYYRGMRVFDFPKDVSSIYTYNFLGYMQLTEDRTAKHPFILEANIADMVAASEDKEFIKSIARAPYGSFESKLNFTYADTPPSEAFRAVGRMTYASGGSIGRYTIQHTPPSKIKPPYTIRELLALFEGIPDELDGFDYIEYKACAAGYLDGTYEGLD